jgi:aspartyl-tRNA(Asn)/glutamyl-tRNA(Gln) amidotransferase subunit A
MSLTKCAGTYVANQAKYAHLNAFITRVDAASLTNRPESLQTDLRVEDRPVAIKDTYAQKT